MTPGQKGRKKKAPALPGPSILSGKDQSLGLIFAGPETRSRIPALRVS